MTMPSSTNQSVQAYKYSGKEFADQAGLNLYDYGARWYDPARVQFTTMDPLAEKYPWMSPYVYCNNNPISAIDPDGRDWYYFDEVTGDYINKVKVEGEHRMVTQSVTKTKNGGTITTYNFVDFVDPINDPKAIDNAGSGKIIFVTDDYIYQTLENSGVYNKGNQGVIAGSKYLLNERDASSIKGNGNMDYTGNGRNNIDISPTTLYITQTRSGNFAHNAYNFGNFLWGAGANALGISEEMARIGAHVNNYLWDPKHKGTWDSKDDQFSIILGYEWRYVSTIEKIIMRNYKQQREKYIRETR